MKEKLLNIGCGTETYGTHFIDIHPSRKNVIKCNVDKERLPFPDNYFDKVYSKFLFEHLKNPGFAIQEMVRVLKPNGKLVLITDNAHYIGFHLSIFGANLHTGRYQTNKINHYALYTPFHLTNFLLDEKIKNIKWEYIDDRTRWYVKILKFIIRIFSPKLSYPHIMIKGRKR
jgi:ubiquinone/menaquinone biosynthesis C-methylase UbiE